MSGDPRRLSRQLHADLLRVALDAPADDPSELVKTIAAKTRGLGATDLRQLILLSVHGEAGLIRAAEREGIDVDRERHLAMLVDPAAEIARRAREQATP